NFGMQFNGSLFDVLSWAIIKGSPNRQNAEQLLYFAGTPGIEAQLFRATGEAGLAKGANDGLSANLLPMLPTMQNNLGAALRIDTAFWHQNLAKLQKRFDSWLNAH
ncbi:MAG TPA: ABC transporter substrate-binding protein, partial [Acetobacteraceae bacterium]|nr:ABC transporter substrate-binding protein [Acetobacteraceae bacterium]